ncbi:D-alanine--D-alanine ligase [Striga asiatica]|uniref:D-alanine--D-alanine ligase n=1 Tax=Striga asiatica TaxID=4170 RepID=A0A5A7NYA4_STRAF|nr:D-alanine--D-alanine ligase [Striga asiatica]
MWLSPPPRIDCNRSQLSAAGRRQSSVVCFGERETERGMLRRLQGCSSGGMNATLAAWDAQAAGVLRQRWSCVCVSVCRKAAVKTIPEEVEEAGTTQGGMAYPSSIGNRRVGKTDGGSDIVVVLV